MEAKKCSAFTMLEMLIVVLLVGVLVASISLTLPNSANRTMKMEAGRLARLFEYARVKALVDDKVYGFSLNGAGTKYRWWSLSQKGQWKVLEKKPFETESLPDMLVAKLSVLDSDYYEEGVMDGPQVLFQTDTGTNAFTIALYVKENAEQMVVLKTDGLSSVSW